VQHERRSARDPVAVTARCVFCAIVAGQAEASVVGGALQSTTTEFRVHPREAKGQTNPAESAQHFRRLLHVLPRFPGDGFGLRVPDDYRVRGRAELEEVAARIRAAWR
jgi:hypothetical protein